LGEGQEAIRPRLPRRLPNAVFERLSAAEWVHPGTIPDRVHVLGSDVELGGAVLIAGLFHLGVGIAALHMGSVGFEP
jgi:glycine/D-amino acid oxidase-like deaminating enzyme